MREEVALIIETDVDLHEAYRAAEMAGHLAIIRHHGAGLFADVRGFSSERRAAPAPPYEGGV
jgi:hypothetical protein